MTAGKVWLVGAGPGDPGLMTLAGLERLRQADVIVYDRLVSPRLLEHARQDAELIYVGKVAGEGGHDQAKINELLVEKALNLSHHRPIATIAEIGTGCGAIAISLALNLPETKIYAIDISAPALKVALANCQQHGVADRICLLQGDMLDPLPEPVDLIVANLPYVSESALPRKGPVSFEPVVALDGGAGGVEKIRKLCQQAGSQLRPQGCLLLEIGQGQGGTVTALLNSLFPSATIDVTPDLSGIDRVVSLALTR
jgi:release factor glutamine methyltransferase